MPNTVKYTWPLWCGFQSTLRLAFEFGQPYPHPVRSDALLRSTRRSTWRSPRQHNTVPLAIDLHQPLTHDDLTSKPSTSWCFFLTLLPLIEAPICSSFFLAQPSQSSTLLKEDPHLGVRGAPPCSIWRTKQSDLPKTSYFRSLKTKSGSVSTATPSCWDCILGLSKKTIKLPLRVMSAQTTLRCSLLSELREYAEPQCGLGGQG